ncbi:MAG: sigma-70 family RNA polymerase sigma factor [bacterium]
MDMEVLHHDGVQIRFQEVMEVNFERSLEGLFPRLKGIAKRVNGHLRFTHAHQRWAGFIDEDDLMQEMSLHLWKKWKQGELEGKTESYLLQSCWFHLQNYLRTVDDKGEIISFDEPIDSEETTLGEIIPDNSQHLPELINWKIIIEKMRTNGLTKREKEVFALCLEGYTLREIGKRLDISFVRVSKIQKHICKKWNNKIDE